MEKMEEYELILKQKEKWTKSLKKVNTQNTVRYRTEYYYNRIKLLRIIESFGIERYNRIKTISNIIE
jgi:hypothetical protein